MMGRLVVQPTDLMPTYRVVDLLNETIDPEARIVEAGTPELAAELALGVRLTRSGARRNLRCRVYHERAGQPPSMFRLYTRVSETTP